MPPPKDFSTKLDAQSSIANYVNNLSNSEYNEERERYEEQEPMAKSKSWEEFLRLAISRQYLEGRSGNAKVEVRDGSKLLLRTGKRKNDFFGFGKREELELDVAIAKLERRAWKYTKEQPDGAASSRRGNHKAEEQDAEPRRQLSIAAPPRRQQAHPNYEEVNDRTSLHDRRTRPALPQEYVYPAGPPIVITMPSQSSDPQRQNYQPPAQRPVRTRSHLSSVDAPPMSGGLRPPVPSDRLPERHTSVGELASRIEHRYSDRPSDRHSERRDTVRGPLREDYSHTERWLDSQADGESRARRQGGSHSGASYEPIRSSSSTHSDGRRGLEATLGVPNWGSGGEKSRGSNRR